MPMNVLDAPEFISRYKRGGIPLVDARSESEFEHASIPGSVNLPLLINEHRKKVGTTYRNQGREAAILEGFRLTGPRFHELLEYCQTHFPSREAMVYCWRGGMRSSILGWLLETGGFRITLLKGGYKAFRKWTSEAFRPRYRIKVLGGPTGSGKTEILQAMKQLGAQVLDLEYFANHRGSAFGGLGMGPQPSTEMFENFLAMALAEVDDSKDLWIENESRSIGSCMLPQPVYEAIRLSHVIELEVPLQERMERITREYGRFPVQELRAATLKVNKRMGPQHAKAAITHLESGDFTSWLQLLLAYYDRLYQFGSAQREPTTRHTLSISAGSAEERAQQVLDYAQNQMSNPKPITT